MKKWLLKQNIFVRILIFITISIFTSWIIIELSSSGIKSIDEAKNLQVSWIFTTMLIAIYVSVFFKKK